MAGIQHFQSPQFRCARQNRFQFQFWPDLQYGRTLASNAVRSEARVLKMEKRGQRWGMGGAHLNSWTSEFRCAPPIPHLRSHHAIGRRSLKKPPVGPSSGSVASQTVVSTPCRTDRGADGPPISVRTQPGSTELASTPRTRYVWARMRVNAFSAAFDME